MFLNCINALIHSKGGGGNIMSWGGNDIYIYIEREIIIL